MSVLVDILLILAVASAWLGAFALLRLSPLGRIHAVSFVNVAAGAAVTLAVCLSDGLTSRTGKTLLIWVVVLLTSALSSHVTGRAIHLRSGERQ